MFSANWEFKEYFLQTGMVLTLRWRRVLKGNVYFILFSSTIVCLDIHVFLRKWFIRKQCSTAQKAKKIGYWIFEIRHFMSSYTFSILLFTQARHLFDLNHIFSPCTNLFFNSLSYIFDLSYIFFVLSQKSRIELS